MDKKDLERRIREIALETVGEKNFCVESALDIFSETLPYHTPTKTMRMVQFIKKYKEIKDENTKNILFMPQALIPFWPMKEEDITCQDYFRFFWDNVDDQCYDYIPGAPIPDVLPHTTTGSLNYMVHGAIYHDFMSNPEFGRLGWVNQLGTVAHAFVYFFLHQTRADHSIRTAMINDLVLTRNRFSDHDVRLSIVAGLLHDLATPPFSDQGKLAARSELDEEDLVESVLSQSKRMHALLKKYGLSQAEVVDTIRGKGIVGRLMNSTGIDTDKIAYVSRDFDLASNMTSKSFIRAIYTDCPDLFHLFKDIKFVDDEPVYSDPHKVMRFLQLRALMFSEVYMNPFNRAREAFLERELSKLWGKILKNGDIFNVDFMMTHGDCMFETFLSDESKVLDLIFKHTVNNHFLEIRREYDLTKYEALKKEYTTEDFVVRRNHGFNPATSTPVLSDGIIMPIRDVYPGQCSLVEKVADRLNYVGVYHQSERPVAPDTNKFYRQLDRRAGRVLMSMRQNI
jgi:HD superfamily phosphohydrolase